MLIDKFAYKSDLTELWHIVFKDSYDYIDLIFKEDYRNSVLCFADLDEKKVVSALYLIKNHLHFDGKDYNGYYLYAAATLPEYRKKGIMSCLIKEAQLYCESKGLDYISLVPSNEMLYSYYSVFGFKEAMYCFESFSLDGAEKTEISFSEYYSKRSKLSCNYFNLNESTFSYAADCFAFSGLKFYRTDNDCLCICSQQGEDLIEVISHGKPTEKNMQKCKFGMLFPINDELKRDWKYTDIYMNIALD